MTLSWSETSTVPVNEQQSAYWDMSLSIFAALSGVSAAEADEICQRRVKRRTRRMNFFIVALTFRDGLACQVRRDYIFKTATVHRAIAQGNSSPWLRTRWPLSEESLLAPDLGAEWTIHHVQNLIFRFPHHLCGLRTTQAPELPLPCRTASMLSFAAQSL